MKPTRIAALCLALVFVAGALFGFVAHSLYSERSARASNPKEYRERYITKLQKDLSLTQDQVNQATAILDQTGERFREIRERMDPEFDTIRQDQRQRIMAALTPEQQPKYQQIVDEWRRQHERHGHTIPPPSSR